ncbi:MAG: cysteine peptidase family C39 domain-containing protein [bacterium]
MNITPYEQSLTHSCLVASFLMILLAQKGVSFQKKDEQELALLGSQRTYPFYVVGITAEVTKRYNANVHVFADNKFFTDVLKDSFAKEKNIEVEHQKITTTFIKKLLVQSPVICHIDTHGLGDYSHASHFIVIEKANKSTFTIIDPWNGKRRNVSEKTLEKAILELKNNVKMCPLIFLVK